MELSTIINIFIALFLVWFLFKQFAPIKGLKVLKDQEFRDKMKASNSFLIDVREPHEYKTGYIAGAKNMPLSQFKKHVETIPKDKGIFLYCQSGMRSKKAARILNTNGFSELSHLQGGLLSWTGKTNK
jgi:rhodanese-related sulfurtransferase